ncbi:MAG: tRNA (adenosine(37)-N6)-threonylcarbamoyltransferase complex ATPase subunit type 1 TsaE [bacterium]
MQKFESDSPQKTEIIAKEFAKQLKPLDFVSINGLLGAGKTKFSSGIIRFFCSGVDKKIFAASPSYSLMNSYDCGITVNHFDFYRLKTVYDLENCGFFDSLEGENITIAEWADIVKIDYKKYVSGSYYVINIKIKGDEKKEKRFIEIEKIF